MTAIIIMLLSAFAIVAMLTVIYLLEIRQPRSAKSDQGGSQGSGRA
jgi:hypothetical protein